MNSLIVHVFCGFPDTSTANLLWFPNSFAVCITRLIPLVRSLYVQISFCITPYDTHCVLPQCPNSSCSKLHLTCIGYGFHHGPVRLNMRVPSAFPGVFFRLFWNVFPVHSSSVLLRFPCVPRASYVFLCDVLRVFAVRSQTCSTCGYPMRLVLCQTEPSLYVPSGIFFLVSPCVLL